MTGLLYISPDSKDVHDQNETVAGAALQPAARTAVPGQRRAAEVDGAVQVDLDFGSRISEVEAGL